MIPTGLNGHTAGMYSIFSMVGGLVAAGFMIMVYDLWDRYLEYRENVEETREQKATERARERRKEASAWAEVDPEKVRESHTQVGGWDE